MEQAEVGMEHGARAARVFRFAPSPNGLLHLGHAYSALLNLKMARGAGGRLLLRIEDIDTARCTPAWEEAMLADLEWIGFEWDEPPLRQSQQFDRYAAVLDSLFDEGLVYPSRMTRGGVRRHLEAIAASGRSWPADPDGTPLYPGGERELPMRERMAMMESAGDCALRLDTRAALARVEEPLTWLESGAGPAGETGMVAADPLAWGDPVLGRKGLPASFHLCVTLDDAMQGITDVVRGRDLFRATAIHRLLQETMSLPVPQYHHHDLVLDPSGRKLSKSRGDTALRHLREAGMTPYDISRMIGLD